jgi:hypothetical protein
LTFTGRFLLILVRPVFEDAGLCFGVTPRVLGHARGWL